MSESNNRRRSQGEDIIIFLQLLTHITDTCIRYFLKYIFKILKTLSTLQIILFISFLGSANYTFAEASSSHLLTKQDVNEWLEEYMLKALDRTDVAGAVVTIVKDGKILHNSGYGYADLESKKEVDPDKTLFRLASLSKLFVWTAVMQLVEQGKVNLDVSITNYIDFKLPLDKGDITLRHLMTHSAGFEDTIKNAAVFGVKLGDNHLRDYLINQVPKQIFEPGEVSAYSNYGTNIAGYIVQLVSGMQFETYVEENIFKPLAMNRTTFRQPLPLHLRNDLATAYRTKSEGKPLPEFEMFYGSTSGASSSSGSDMAQFMISHLAQGNGILQPDTAHIMHNSITRHYPQLNGMALGFMERDYNGLKILGHSGSVTWFRSDLSLILNENVGLFIAYNSVGNSEASFLRRQLLVDFLERYFPSEGTTNPEAISTAREHGKLIAGNYELSRRVNNSLFSMRPLLLQQVVVNLNDNDELDINVIVTPNGEAVKWVEVEPWVWQKQGGKLRLAAKVVGGKVESFAMEPSAGGISLISAPWYRSSALLMPVFLLSTLLMILTIFVWPVSWLIGKIFKNKKIDDIVIISLIRKNTITAMVPIAYIVALGTFVGWLLNDYSNLMAEKSEHIVLILYYAALSLLVATAYFIVLNVYVWKNDFTWIGKTMQGIILLAMLGIVWVAYSSNFFSFNMNY